MEVGGHAATVGAAAEAFVSSRLMANGYTVLEPRVTEPFDMAVVTGSGRFCRIQVKGTARKGRYSYEFSSRRKKTERYTKDDVDYVVFCALDADMCWVVPVEAIDVGRLSIRPNGGRWERYRERWELE